MWFSLPLLAHHGGQPGSPALGRPFFLLQQLSKEGARNPQPRGPTSAFPASLGGAGDRRRSQTFPILQPNVTSSLGAQLGDVNLSLGIFHPSLGETGSGGLLSGSATSFTLSDPSGQLHGPTERGAAGRFGVVCSWRRSSECAFQ